MDYTVDAIVQQIKDYGAVPNGQPSFSDPKLLDIVNRALRNNISPKIKRLNEELFTTSISYTIDPNTISTTGLPMPTNAMGGVLRDIKFINGTDEISIPRLDIATRSVDRLGFIIENNTIKIYNSYKAPSTSLKVWYFKRQSELVLSTKCAKIANIVGNVVTVYSLPSNIINGATIDVTSSNPNFDFVATDTISNISSLDITVSDASKFSVGDYISQLGYACFPNIPPECYDWLVFACIEVIEKTLGDFEGLKVTIQDLTNAEHIAIGLLTPRVVGQPTKMVRKNSLYGARVY